MECAPSDVPSKSLIARGKPLRSQTREIVYNVAQYFIAKKKEEEEKGALRNKYNIRDLTARITGVSTGTVSKVLKEAQSEGFCFSTPSKQTPHKKKIDTFTDQAIRYKIHEFYAIRRQCPSIMSVLESLKEDNEHVDCSKEYLRRRIHGCGFKWKRCKNRTLLMEKPKISGWRGRYLRAIKDFREEGRYIAYLDETYIQGSQNVSSLNSENEPPQNIGKGNRLVVVLGGGEMGFLNNSSLIFTSSTSSDSQTSMKFGHFSKWLDEMFLPNLPPNSVIVVDNGHCEQLNKRPTYTTLKKDVVTWLRNNNVEFEESWTKAELMMLVKNSPAEKLYKVDVMIRTHGHSVLHLPPHHQDLNPTQLVWADINGQLDSEPVGTFLREKEAHLKRLFCRYTLQLDKWKKICEDVKEVEEKYRLMDHIVEDEVERFMITAGTNSDSVSEFSSSDSDSDQ